MVGSFFVKKVTVLERNQFISFGKDKRENTAILTFFKIVSDSPHRRKQSK